MRKLLILPILVLLCTPATARTFYARTCSYADVSAAVALAGGGDTVLVPAGTCTWTSMLGLNKAIYLKGAGIGQTTLVNGITNTSFADFLIHIAPADISEDPIIDVSGFTFNANSEGGCVRINCEDNTYACYNFRVHHNRCENVLDADGDSYMGIRLKGDTFGLIDHNEFYNNLYDLKIYGDDQNSWDLYPGIANRGGRNFSFIESNTSVAAEDFFLTSGEGARWVYRHNWANNSTMDSGSAGWDAHGDTSNDGVVGFELYENHAVADVGSSARSGYKFVDYRGGTGMIFNNSVQVTTSGVRAPIYVREEYAGCNDPVTGGFIWNNTNSLDGVVQAVGDNVFGDKDPYGCIAENVDWWDDGDSDNGLEDPLNFFYDVAANRNPTTCSDEDSYFETDTRLLYYCDADNNWTYIYRPYVYPLPTPNQNNVILGSVATGSVN